MRNRLYLLVGLLMIILAAAAVAQEPAGEQQAPPPMGPPPEMQDLSFLVGDWDVNMRMGMNPDTTTWETSTGTCTYAYILDGAVMQMNYEGTAMGMPFLGMGLQCFDRETGLWQVTWSDNMSARISLYTGKKENGKIVVTGEDLYYGQKFLSRLTTFNETKTSFDWTMEYSTDGGKTFLPSAFATYTKRVK